ncbi:hypothetical protein [Variovorax paradoxus]|uniref:hypothetical protein n=1 Tax=Variovorax paradoxus TaxID=34073 RepID=UPI0012BBA6A3|nr:hypothetical protein [Variovorax paradoxus]
MSAKPLLTVEKFAAWLEVTAVVREQQEIESRARIVDATLRDVAMRTSWGLMPACDFAWRCRGRNAAPEVRRIVEDALRGIGWVHPKERAAGK